MTQESLNVRHADEWIVIVDKPSGLPTQGTRDSSVDHLYAQILKQYPDAALHHRLDRPSSGLVLFTINKTVNPSISKAFREHTIDRRYLAVLAGDPGQAGTWNHNIDGKRAVTHFKRIGVGDGMALIEARLETGRTHQIRVHAALSGQPIVGDRRHGGAAGRLWPRLALHAVTLALSHPVTGQPLRVDSPPPPDLTPLMASLHSDLARRYSPETEAD